MKFTDAEKLMISMLCDIKDAGEEFDTTLIREALQGREWALRLQHPHVFSDEPVPAHVTELIAILEMWTQLERAAQHIDPAAFKELTGLALAHFRFEGFDAATESEHFANADMLIRRMHKFRNYASAGLDSRAPTVGRYRRMLVLFEQLRATAGGGLLGLGELAAIANAGSKPA